MQRGYSYDTNLVLRTVYLPRDLDNRLRDMAFKARTSKNEVIRRILQDVLAREEAICKPEEEFTNKVEVAAVDQPAVKGNELATAAV